jgi:hypothetical protein
MSDPTQTLKDDIAFLRELTQDPGAGFARDGTVMVLVGSIFGIVDLAYWTFYRGWLHPPTWMTLWLWAAGLAVFFIIGHLATRRLPAPTGAAARAMAAGWSGVGVSLTAAGAGLILGGLRLHQPQLTLQVFPIVLFALYGSGWAVAYAVKRKAWFAWVTLGCLTTAVACGALMGSPDEWLALSIGLFAMVAAPGAAIVRQAG